MFLGTKTMEDNVSIGYFLQHAFEYEIRNKLDIRLSQLSNLQKDLTPEQNDELRLLQTVREYLQHRIASLKR